jgi:hypothetical protein
LDFPILVGCADDKGLIADAVRLFGGSEPDLVEFGKQIDFLDKKLDVYDAILSKQKYLAGDVRLSFR